MLKFATKLALSLAILGTSLSPASAAPPKGMKLGPALGSGNGSQALSSRTTNSRPNMNLQSNLGGLKLQGNLPRIEPQKLKLPGQVQNLQVFNPNLNNLKPNVTLKPQLSNKHLDQVFGNIGIKPIKPIDPGFGNGKPIVDLGKLNHGIQTKPFHCGTFPNSSCGPKNNWGCGGWGGILSGGLGCWNPGNGCGNYCPMPYPHWHHCHTWINYCPSYCTSVVTTPIVIETNPIVAVPVGNVDLVVEGIQLLEMGDPSKNLGPLVRVIVSNKGNAAAGQFALGVFASLQEAPSNEMIPSGEMLDGLEAGATRPVDVRLPIEVLAMSAGGSPQREMFKQLFLVADVENKVVEVSKQNNVLPVKREQLLGR